MKSSFIAGLNKREECLIYNSNNEVLVTDFDSLTLHLTVTLIRNTL